MICYRSRRALGTELWARLHNLPNRRRRFCYHRLSILLPGKSESSGLNRIYRLYREEGLDVRKRRSRCKAVTIIATDGALPGQSSNRHWKNVQWQVTGSLAII
jgi:hypothetical protein